MCPAGVSSDELASEAFRGLDRERRTVILLVAAIEQHEPHLPVADLRKMLPDEAHVLVLPTQAYGKSNEHLLTPGASPFPAHALLEVLTEIRASVTRAGLCKIVLLNSPGGNFDVRGIVAGELRCAILYCVLPRIGDGSPFDGLYHRGST